MAKLKVKRIDAGIQYHARQRQLRSDFFAFFCGSQGHITCINHIRVYESNAGFTGYLCNAASKHTHIP